MREVAESRTNRSEIILVSITRKSLTGSPGLERGGAPLTRQSKESSQRPPSPEYDDESKSVCRQER